MAGKEEDRPSIDTTPPIPVNKPTSLSPSSSAATTTAGPWPTKHAAIFENLDPRAQNIIQKFVFMDLNKVEDEDLYIGSMFTLRKPEKLKEEGITHILSVLNLTISKDVQENFTCMKVEADDIEEENLIQHFERTNKFIQDALDGGGKVFIHCAMGKSRSATILIAYLIYKHKYSPDIALAHVRRTRSLCEPNTGFWKQLELYFNNLEEAIKGLEDLPAYQRFVYNQEVRLARYEHRAPRVAHYLADVDPNVAAAAGTTSGADGAGIDRQYRCKRCRRVLATSKSINEHEPLQAGGVMSTPQNKPQADPLQPCAHHFVDPMEWMRTELEKGELSGKLDCPKCQAKVGSYVWHGMKCSCGRWVVPGLSLARGKVDEIKLRPSL